MNLYEVNQAMYQNVPPITDFDGAQRQIKNYLEVHPSKYYLMLNNEERYYTLYTFKEQYKFGDMADDILEIARDLGEIKDITTNSSDALEFWIMYNNKPTLFMLFDYTDGVIEV